MKDRLMPLFFPKTILLSGVNYIAMPLNGNIFWVVCFQDKIDYLGNHISSLLLYSNDYSLGVKFA